MLWFTPEVDEAFAWFYATHELASDLGRVWWRRTSLPGAGGYGDQDAKRMATIEYVHAIMTEQLQAPKRDDG